MTVSGFGAPPGAARAPPCRAVRIRPGPVRGSAPKAVRELRGPRLSATDGVEGAQTGAKRGSAAPASRLAEDGASAGSVPPGSLRTPAGLRWDTVGGGSFPHTVLCGGRDLSELLETTGRGGKGRGGGPALGNFRVWCCFPGLWALSSHPQCCVSPLTIRYVDGVIQQSRGKAELLCKCCRPRVGRAGAQSPAGSSDEGWRCGGRCAPLVGPQNATVPAGGFV